MTDEKFGYGPHPDVEDDITRALNEDLTEAASRRRRPRLTEVVFPPSSTEMRHDTNPPIGHNGVNPKDRIGRAKAGLWAIPPTAMFYLGAVLESGAEKYGLYNWRDSAVDISVYFDALQRHMLMFRDGEILDPESGLPHLAHAMANCAIILDAMESGNYHLDLGSPGPLARTLQKLAERKRERG